jgi:hypothetical protein
LFIPVVIPLVEDGLGLFFDGEVFKDFFAQSILRTILEDRVNPAIGKLINAVGIVFVFQLLGLLVGI